MKTSIADNIEHYYFYQLDHLHETQKIHWLLRHYLWFQDDLSERLLKNHKSHYVLRGDTSYKHFLQKGLTKPTQKIVKTHVSRRRQRRAKLLASDYPRLAKINTVLFKVLFAYTGYDVDMRHILPAIIAPEEISALRKKLIQHPEHLKTLSTPAVNFLYLSEWAYNLKRQKPSLYLDALDNRTQQDHPLNLLYLLTHAIIGETRFYSRRLQYNKKTYVQMLQQIDAILEDCFEHLSLDIKTESLLCSRLLGKPLSSERNIQNEIEKSIQGQPYLIDRYNSFKRKGIKSLSASEHRNILYVMAMHPVPDHLAPK